MSSDGTKDFPSSTAAEMKRANNDLTGAICKYNNYFGSSDVVQQKFEYMRNKQVRQEKADQT